MAWGRNTVGLRNLCEGGDKEGGSSESLHRQCYDCAVLSAIVLFLGLPHPALSTLSAITTHFYITAHDIVRGLLHCSRDCKTPKPSTSAKSCRRTPQAQNE